MRYALQATGVMDPDVPLYELDLVNVIHVRLLGFERVIRIEVWDNATEPAGLPGHEEGEELHGLGLVDARAKDWGSYLVPGGRVVWAELAVYERTAAGLPRRRGRQTTLPRPPVGAGEHPSQDVDFLRRVRDRLGAL